MKIEVLPHVSPCSLVAPPVHKLRGAAHGAGGGEKEILICISLALVVRVR
jgi:hypothetical protein